MEEDFGPDIITVTDEDGEEYSFEVLDEIEENGTRYLALLPAEEGEEMLESDGNLVIMKVAEEDGEEFLDAVEDEAEFTRIGQQFQERLQDLYDIEDPEKPEKKH